MYPDADSSDPPSLFTSHGKLLLFGEHAAVYGYPALGVSLDCSFNLSVSPSSTGTVDFPGLSDRDKHLAQSLLEKAEELIPGLHIEPATYTIDSSVPESSGFGSSAAVCAALSRYALRLAGEQNIITDHLFPAFQHSEHWPEEEKEQYLHWSIANQLEKQFHGSPSGIDTGLALSQGIQAFFPRSRRLPDRMPLSSSEDGIWIMYAAVPREGNTKSLVQAIERAMLDEVPKVTAAIERLGEAAHEAITCLQDTDCGPAAQAKTIGELAAKAHGDLATLDLSNDHIDRILEKGMKLGCTGGKLSGAGGGGAFFLVTEGSSSAKELQEQLTVFCRTKNIELSSGFQRMRI